MRNEESIFDILTILSLRTGDLLYGLTIGSEIKI
ncbi:hypothetical protein HNP87_001399 [Methanococcus maripaludis]|uniref:Uncharacterized protein n=1 Tax=Methanococcus maripaludis TaxID=39152 RepID=A0A7J9NJL5_METMI|nr:hypothetical protein [Methanococcus maripaludis]